MSDEDNEEHFVCSVSGARCRCKSGSGCSGPGRSEDVDADTDQTLRWIRTAVIYVDSSTEALLQALSLCGRGSAQSIELRFLLRNLDSIRMVLEGLS